MISLPAQRRNDSSSKVSETVHATYSFQNNGDDLIMKLLRVNIANFRSVKDVTIELEPSCRILVGINESGKSNILKALALLDPEESVDPDDLRNFPPDEDSNQQAFVLFVFGLEKNERITIYESLSEKILTQNQSAPITLTGDKGLSFAQLIDSRHEGLFKVDLRTAKKFGTVWATSGDGFSVDESWRKPSDACPPAYMVKIDDGSTAPLKNFSFVHASASEEIPEAFLTKVTPEDITTAIRIETAKFITENLPGCLYWTYSDSHLLPPSIGLDTFAAKPNGCKPLKHMFALADIANVAAEIEKAKQRSQGIRNLLNRVGERATKHMQAVWKEYKGLRIELIPNGPNIDAHIKDEHNLYDFSRRSDGFKRFITFLLMVSAKVRTEDLVNTLILHDEPDISLHPSGARYLRDELIKISDTNYVVYSTHSIFMIDREHINRHLMVEKKSEATIVREVDESNIVDEEVIYNALGYSIFESLRPKNIVFEGWRDKQLFRIALKSSQSKQRGLKSAFDDIGICHARGVRDVGRITPMLELVGKKWLVVSDGDKPAVEQQKHYDGEGPWLRYDQLCTQEGILTGEDFLKPEAFKPHLDQIRSECPSLPEFPLEELNGPEAKLSTIRKWLIRGGITPDTAKPMLEGLKERLFNSLKPTLIEDRYYSFLEALQQHLNKI